MSLWEERDSRCIRDIGNLIESNSHDAHTLSIFETGYESYHRRKLLACSVKDPETLWISWQAAGGGVT